METYKIIRLEKIYNIREVLVQLAGRLSLRKKLTEDDNEHLRLLFVSWLILHARCGHARCGHAVVALLLHYWSVFMAGTIVKIWPQVLCVWVFHNDTPEGAKLFHPKVGYCAVVGVTSLRVCNAKKAGLFTALRPVGL